MRLPSEAQTEVVSPIAEVPALAKSPGLGRTAGDLLPEEAAILWEPRRTKTS